MITRLLVNSLLFLKTSWQRMTAAALCFLSRCLVMMMVMMTWTVTVVVVMMAVVFMTILVAMVVVMMMIVGRSTVAPTS